MDNGIRTLADLQGRCKRDDMTGCLVMQGNQHHGSVYVWLPALGRPVALSRALAVVTGAKLKPGQMLVPRCGNTRCADMAHRFIGTRSDLMKILRPTLPPEHRMRIAAAHRAKPTSKYDPELRAQLLTSDATLVELERQTGLHRTTVSKIRLGLTWADGAPASSVFTYRP